MSENLPAAAPALAPAEQTKSIKPLVADEHSILLDTNKFEHLYRVAQMFAGSSLVPEIYQGKPQNCFVACHMAHQLQVDPLVYMQNSYVYKGKPGIEGKLAISLINSRGPYKDGINFEMSGEGDKYGCVAWGKREDGSIDRGPRVSIEMAKAEQWYERNPKWKNMPELMLQYRAAMFLARTKFPHILHGLQEADEIRDIGGVEVVTRRTNGKLSAANELLGDSDGQ